MTVFTSVFLALLSVVAARPALEKRQTLVATSTIDSYTPYTNYAGAGYCGPTAVQAWNCGAYCSANPSFEPVAEGGDGDTVQYWYVGYDPTLNNIIVGHQGTNTSEIAPLVEDGDATLGNLDPSLFPGLSSSIEVDEGFASAQAAAATDVLSAVQTALSTYSTSTVTVVGHSLGAAIALLDSVYFNLQLSGVQIITITYSMPRVGNPDFADWVDANLSLTHITNEIPFPSAQVCLSAMPIQPERSTYIAETANGTLAQAKISQYCTVGDVPNIFDGDLSDHDGPFNGITVSSSGCS